MAKFPEEIPWDISNSISSFWGLHGKAFYLQKLVARGKQNPRPPAVNTFGACTGTSASVSLKILRKRSSNHRCGAKKVWMFYWICLHHQCYCWEGLPPFSQKIILFTGQISGCESAETHMLGFHQLFWCNVFQP